MRFFIRVIIFSVRSRETNFQYPAKMTCKSKERLYRILPIPLSLFSLNVHHLHVMRSESHVTGYKNIVLTRIFTDICLKQRPREDCIERTTFVYSALNFTFT